MSDPVLLEAAQTWLIERWLENFTQVLESMVDERPALRWTTEGTTGLGPNPLLIEHKFVQSPDPLLWIGVPEETWRDLGSRVLLAAGVETAADDESRSTCLEIMQQSIGGLAQAMTGKLAREIAGGGSREPAFFPEGLTTIRVSVHYADKQLPPIWIAFAPLLTAWMEEKPAAAPPPTPPLVEAPETPATAYPASKTFDLLLDVALPVSVSFGKTELAVKDVLKLTMGSIVELNRGVSDPVDVIVNNCVIARGEVVVVDGNYGVRIHQIVSRQERLRTGSASAATRVNREG
jgi:flagellar motor switch protein FliN/FliY